MRCFHLPNYNAMSFERCKLLFQSIVEDILFGFTELKVGKYKNLCGRDGRTICGPLRVPKSTYVTLAISDNRSFSILDVRP